MNIIMTDQLKNQMEKKHVSDIVLVRAEYRC